MVAYKATSMLTIERQLQLQINAIEKWANENGFKISADKTVAVHFCKKRKHHPDPDLYLDRTKRIPVRDEANFLGVIFDKKLSFLPHIKNLKKKAQNALNILKTISSMEWGQRETHF